MSWVTSVWTAVAAVSATLGIIHVIVWTQDRKAWANLAFSLTAFGVTGIAAFELALMHTSSAARFGELMRWTHVPIFVVQTGIVCFVALYFSTARKWLACAVVATRLASLALNFLLEPNLNYRAIHALEQVPFLGEPVWIVADAVRNPWVSAGELSSLLLLVFVADASLTLWRRRLPEDRRRAVMIGASLVFLIVVAAGDGALIHHGVMRGPYLISVPFLPLLLVMAGELSRDVFRAARMGEELRELREELAHVTRVTTLSELSGSLAHELNQPLATILSNAQAAQRLLAKSPPDIAEVRDILGDIVTEDRRAGEVIKRLRALLKRGELDPVPLSLHDAIDEVLHLLHADFASRGIAVVRSLASELPRVRGDRVQLQQVILNLLVNAADAMHGAAASARELHLRTERRDGVVRLSVRDHGSGLPPEPEKLFAPFYSTKPSGLGLGLAICRSIAGVHGGRLWAESHPERGAVFHLELPALHSSAE